MVERYFLTLPDEEWAKTIIHYGDNGQPLVSFDEQGKVSINDPFLAALDAEIRAGLGG